MMIRVKIRLSHKNAEGKILRFHKDTAFDTLITKIASKLGVAPTSVPSAASAKNVCTLNENDKTSSSLTPSSVFNLYLGDDILVEDTDEIDEGDDLVLRVKNRTAGVDRLEGGMEMDERDGKEISGAATHRSGDSEGHGNRDKSDDDQSRSSNSCIEDVTDSIKEQLNRKRKAMESIDLVSSCSEDDSSDEDFDEDNNSDDEEEEGGDEDDDESYVDSEKEDPDMSNDEESSIGKKRKRKTQYPSPQESPLKVLMDEKDMPASPGVHPESAFNQDTISDPGKADPDTDKDRIVKDRIIKLLNTGFHDKSNEHEAKNAIKLAQRLMNKHNLSQAILLQERDNKNKNNTMDDKGEILKGGMVKVQIINRKTSKPALLARWIGRLLSPLSENFGVENFYEKTRGYQCSVTFYGIYTNCQLAAYAFRVSVERISQMATSYNPVRIDSNVGLKSARLSYALGIVKGISEEVKVTLRREREMREEKLKRAQNALTSGMAYEESEDEDDDIGMGCSFSSETKDDDVHLNCTTSGTQTEKKSDDKFSNSENTQASKAPKLKSTTLTSTPNTMRMKSYEGGRLGQRLKELQNEEQAALVLVDHRKKVAEQVLEQNDIKIRAAAKKKPILFDRRSFDKGIEDSKEIDINQRAIKCKNKSAK